VSTSVIEDDSCSVMRLPNTEIEVTVGFVATPEIVKSDGFAEMSFTSSLIERLIVVVVLTNAEVVTGASPSNGMILPLSCTLPLTPDISSIIDTSGVSAVPIGVPRINVTTCGEVLLAETTVLFSTSKSVAVIVSPSRALLNVISICVEVTVNAEFSN